MTNRRTGPALTSIALATTSFVALMSTASLASAQTTAAPSPQDPAPAAQEAASSVEDIIVTATRQSRRLEEVPAAVTAVGGQQIERSGVTKLMDAAQLAPGLQIQKNGYTTQPSLRGVTSLTSGYGFENNVAIYIDGFYQPDSVAINGDLVNIAQVEILKGPQGTLYGRNATGGAILINTREPSNTFGGRIQASYARFNERGVQGYVSGPLSDWAAFSLAGSARRSDGYIRDLGTDGQGTGGYDAAPQINDSLRGKLRLTPTPRATFTLGYNYARVLDAVGLVYTIYDHASPAIPTPPLRATQPDTATNNDRADNEATLNEGTLKSQIDTGIGELTLRTSYGQRETRIAYDFDGSKSPITYGVIPASQKTFQQSADWNLDLLDNLDLIVGAQYFHDDIDIHGQETYGAGVLRTTDFTRLKAEAYAAYVDATYNFGRLALTAGLRYSSEDKSVAYYQVANLSTITPVQPAARDATFTATTPRFVARYEIAPRTNIYASYSRGYRSGVFQNQVAAQPAFVLPIQPEEITAYEVGFKTVRSSFRFDTAAFFYDYTNLQVGVTVPNPVSGVGVINTILNAKGAEIYGAEAQITWTPLQDLNVIGGLSLLHAEYTDFTNATGTGLNPSTGLNVGGQTQDWTGQEMARAPASSASLQVDYGWDLGGGRARAALNGSYTASYVVNNPSLFGPLAGADAKTQRYRQGAYGLLNAQASWTAPGDQFTITAFVNNATDTRYKMVTSGGSFGNYRQFNQPRSAGVRLGYAF